MFLQKYLLFVKFNAIAYLNNVNAFICQVVLGGIKWKRVAKLGA